MQLIPLVSDFYYVPVLVALIGATVSVVTDIKWGKIKNVVTFPLIIFGWAWTLIFGDINLFLINIAVTIGLGFLITKTGGIGAGDVKLIAGIVACLQPMYNVVFFLFVLLSFLIAGLLMRFKIHGFKIRKALSAIKEEMKMEGIYRIPDAGYITHGDGIQHIGAPAIFLGLVISTVSALTGGFLI